MLANDDVRARRHRPNQDTGHCPYIYLARPRAPAQTAPIARRPRTLLEFTPSSAAPAYCCSYDFWNIACYLGVLLWLTTLPTASSVAPIQGSLWCDAQSDICCLPCLPCILKTSRSYCETWPPGEPREQRYQSRDPWSSLHLLWCPRQ